MTRGQRITLGIVALGFAAAGLVGWLTGAEVGWPQILLRVAIVLAAIWLAAPGFHRLPRRVAIGLGAGAAMLALRPRFVLGALVLALLVMLLWRRQPSP